MYLLSSGSEWNSSITGNGIFFLLLFYFFLIYMENEGGLVLAIANPRNKRITSVQKNI